MTIASVWLRFRYVLGASGVLLVLTACPGKDVCGGIAPSQRSVTVTPGNLTLDVGEKSSVAAAVGGQCVDVKTVTYASSNPAVATVAASGEVTALTAGSTNITATSTAYGVTGSGLVTVRPPAVQTLALSATALTLRERRTGTLRVTVETTGQLTKRVRFSSSAPGVATVTAIDSVSATITAVAVGTADIDVISDGDATKRATARITVDPALVATVAITGLTADSLVLASLQQLGVTVADSGGVALANRPVTWASLNTSVLTVSATGELRSVAAGTTQITATVPIGDGSGTRTATRSLRVFGSLQVAVAPSSTTVEEGQTVALSVVVSGTPGISRSVTWESSNIARATVLPTGVVTGVLAGPLYVRARSAAVPAVVDSSLVTVLARAVPTVIDARPDVDTLSPLGARQFTATVRDQRNTVITGAPIVWRSLTPTLASVSATGLVTALANGTARIAAASPRSTPSDSLRDTTSILIVDPCTLVRPIQFGATYNGVFDASTCRNFSGYPKVDQFSLTSTTQRSYQVRVAATFPAGLAALAVGSGVWGIPADTAPVVGLAVMRAGTFNMFVTANATGNGTYSVSVTENPNPTQNCVGTDVTRAVTFDTGLILGQCQSRDIRILPAMSAGESITVTATAQAFPAQIELRDGGTNAILASSTATLNGGTATISFTNPQFRFVYFRLRGNTGTVRITIN